MVQYSYDKNKKSVKHCQAWIFDDAKLVIENNKTITCIENRFDYGEQHFITIDLLQHTRVAIVTRETEKKICIISMRKADKNEQTIYYENT